MVNMSLNGNLASPYLFCKLKHGRWKVGILAWHQLCLWNILKFCLPLLITNELAFPVFSTQTYPYTFLFESQCALSIATVINKILYPLTPHALYENVSVWSICHILPLRTRIRRNCHKGAPILNYMTFSHCLSPIKILKCEYHFSHIHGHEIHLIWLYYVAKKWKPLESESWVWYKIR